MRIVIDLQGAQATSRVRGIGRYTLALTQALIRHRGQHEFVIALSDHFPDTIDPIRSHFEALLPKESIVVWYALTPASHFNSANAWRRRASELAREAFLASLKPDVVLVTSMFEGAVDDAVTSIARLSHDIPTAVIVYDLIPHLYPDIYLLSPAAKTWYEEKFEYLKHADLCLAISESSRREVIEHLQFSDESSVNISSDADAHFRRIEIAPAIEADIRSKHGLDRPFVMYTGGVDPRKNIEGLIRAYASLPRSLRESHQLAIVCAIGRDVAKSLARLATKLGLKNGDLILTGYVSDEDLLHLYNLCTLFVFPSWHEGFGLPVLEAMRCGAPVIAANTSSIPEVIGHEEALFAPHSDEAMSAVMRRALTDASYRQSLIDRASAQCEGFSWDTTAQSALRAMERLHAMRAGSSARTDQAIHRPTLAYVSPLPPEKSGISDYSAMLLPALARHYRIDVVVAQETVSDPWVRDHCAIRTVQWLLEHADQYDRILYHLGNSVFHAHMFDLLKTVPGVIVLHDFFLSGAIVHMDVHGLAPGFWGQELYRSHGYPALLARYTAMDPLDVIWKYPCSLGVIQDSLGVIAHSTYSLRLAESWYGGEMADWNVIPLSRVPNEGDDKQAARESLNIGMGDFLVCSFGYLGQPKLNHRLVSAWLKSKLATERNCHLVFVGHNEINDYGRAIMRAIKDSVANDRIHVTGWVDISDYRKYLSAADVGVQLRTLSRGETSAAVLDCMNHGLATIVNANGSMADLDDDAVWKLPDEFEDSALVEALETLWLDKSRRVGMGTHAKQLIVRNHSPAICAEQYANAIERLYRVAGAGLHALPRAIACVDECDTPSDDELKQYAYAVTQCIPPRHHQRQLLVDISELAQHDTSSGIQRVVKSILAVLLRAPPAGYRVEPVYATVDGVYRYARRHTLGLLGCPSHLLLDEPIEYAPGDVLLNLDYQPHVVIAQRPRLDMLRRHGVRVKYVVYDLLCILMPQYFLAAADNIFTRWLEIVLESDGALCISQNVANELSDWVGRNHPAKRQSLKIDWFHLGADAIASPASHDLPSESNRILKRIRSRISFLMVGTLEPRKGQGLILDAFDLLWRNGVEANLVIVGKRGWMVENLVKQLSTHVENSKRLFWLEDAGDDFLEEIYAVSSCLIAASYGEGFGLPLIEAARHRVPIIARDIPVFREVAGEHACYFSADTPEGVARTISAWIESYGLHRHPKSDEMPWLTWRQSADRLLQITLSN